MKRWFLVCSCYRARRLRAARERRQSRAEARAYGRWFKRAWAAYDAMPSGADKRHLLSVLSFRLGHDSAAWRKVAEAIERMNQICCYGKKEAE